MTTDDGATPRKRGTQPGRRNARSSPASAKTAARIARDDAARRFLQRRVLIVVVVSQVLGGAGLAAGITVGALLAQQMLGYDDLTGLPTALFTLGSALAAFLIGRITQRRGRRLGLGLGFAAGGLGALGVVAAAVTGNVRAAVRGAVRLRRRARRRTCRPATPAPTWRCPPGGARRSASRWSRRRWARSPGRTWSSRSARSRRALGIPPLAGPFLLAAVAYLAAGAVLFALLRPDPFLVAQHLRSAVAGRTGARARRAGAEPGAGVVVGATVMVLTQIAMVAIMTMTPVHMRAHGHGLGEVGLVIGIHVGAMFLPSLVTGVLVDRLGRVPMAVASGVTLLLAGRHGGARPRRIRWACSSLALALLGLGWNFGLISGTALLVDATVRPPAPVPRAARRAVALGGAGGGAVSGVVMAGTSYATLSLRAASCRCC